MKTFSNSNICITLAREEWFALLTRLPLEREMRGIAGVSLYIKAKRKLHDQILKSSEQLKERPTLAEGFNKATGTDWFKGE